MTDQGHRSPPNTEREAQEFPELPLVQALAYARLGGDPSDAIYAQEKEGQQFFVGSDTLPTKMSNEARSTLESMGVKFVEVVEDDPLFQYVELPAGWTKQGTNHDMWSKLLDENGQEVASIFYKAAFYDRRASLTITRK